MKITTLLLIAVVALALGACKKDDGPGFDGKTCKLTREVYESTDGKFRGQRDYYYEGDYVSRVVEKNKISLDSSVENFSYVFDGQGRLIKCVRTYPDFPYPGHLYIDTSQYTYFTDSIVYIISYETDGQYRRDTTKYVYDGIGPHFAYETRRDSEFHNADTTFYTYENDNIITLKEKYWNGKGFAYSISTSSFDDKKRYMLYPSIITEYDINNTIYSKSTSKNEKNEVYSEIENKNNYE